MIKQGVSFYSYQNAYRAGRMDMEAMVAEVANLGCDGIELVPVMTPPTSYPKALDAEIDAWHELMDKYHTRPVCLDSIIQCDPAMIRAAKKMNLPPNPASNIHEGADIDEQCEAFEEEMKLAKRLGFPLIRVPLLYGVQMPVYERLLPLAEEMGITFGLEVHVPMTLKGERVQNWIEFIERTGTKNACLIPDMAIFATTLPTKLVHKVTVQGADPDTVKEIVDAYESGKDMNAFAEELKGRGTKGTDELLFFAVRNVPSAVEDLPSVIKYIKHFHAKFYDVNENLEEVGIRFDKVIPELIRYGFDGYLNSEYEGQRMYTPDEFCDEVEQVRRQHKMVDRMLT